MEECKQGSVLLLQPCDDPTTPGWRPRNSTTWGIHPEVNPLLTPDIRTPITLSPATTPIINDNNDGSIHDVDEEEFWTTWLNDPWKQACLQTCVADDPWDKCASTNDHRTQHGRRMSVYVDMSIYTHWQYLHRDRYAIHHYNHNNNAVSTTKCGHERITLCSNWYNSRRNFR